MIISFIYLFLQLTDLIDLSLCTSVFKWTSIICSYNLGKINSKTN